MNQQTQIDPSAEFPKLENMIYSLAWKTANAYPVPFEEARAEAYYAFVRACHDYRPEKKTKLSSWVYFWVWTHLKTFVTKRTVDPLTFVELDDDLCGAAPEPPKLDVEDLSDDAKEIIGLLLETPSELAHEFSELNPHLFLERVKDYLVGKGHSLDNLDWAEREIRLHLRRKRFAMN